MSTKTGKKQKKNFRKGQKCTNCLKGKLSKPGYCKHKQGCQEREHLMCGTCGWTNH